MTLNIKCMAAIMACVSASLADVSVGFPVTDIVVRHLKILKLDFTVDEVGKVTLDAQCSNGAAEPQAVVSAWDGPVGTVESPALYGTSFSLEGIATVNGVPVDQLSTDADESGQGLMVNGARINHAGTEEIVWTYTGLGSLKFTAVLYTGRAAHGDSNLTFLDADTRREYVLPKTSTVGAVNVIDEGFILSNGQRFTVTTDDFKDDGQTPLVANAGATLYGLNFKISGGPSTLGFITE